MSEKRPHKLICYGAGEMGGVYADFLSFLGIEISFWVDSNEKRIGELYLGKELKQPDAISENKDRILITSIYQDEIQEHLSKLGYGNRIVSLKTIIESCVAEERPAGTCSMRVTDETMNIEYDDVKNDENKMTVIFDAYDGCGDWAGTELWALRMSERMNIPNRLFITKGMEDRVQSCSDSTIGFSGDCVCRDMVRIMKEALPIVLVQGFAKHAMLSAAYLKEHYPGKVKIISVLHNDTDACVRRQMLFNEYTDKVFAVSTMVKERAERFFEGQDIDTRIQAVHVPPRNRREYMPDGAIRIGYGARLTKLQKRADLLVDVIQELEIKGISYVLNIAGDGECAGYIKDFVREESVEHKIKFFGKIKPEDMKDFWREQDVFLNLSEYEGCSLSMLEAMSYGCVPVVSDVSGVKEVVVHDENGYIYDVRNIEEAVSYIIDACDKRKLGIMGNKAYDTVKGKCNYEEYIAWWNDYIHDLAGGVSESH